MIIDTLNNLSKYAALNPLFGKAADYIAQNDLLSLPAGKYEIEGKDLFINRNLTKGKTREAARIESHDLMIDIQIPLNVPETMGYTPRTELPQAEYNAEKDITFYPGLAKEYITIHPGQFVIFFPQDGHAPCVSDQDIEKVIFKVRN